MELVTSVLFVLFVIFILHKIFGPKGNKNQSNRLYPDLSDFKSSSQSNSLLKMFNAHHPSAIMDHFTTLDQVTKALRAAGLESSNLIIGVDYTASNNHQGQKTFGGRSLHHIEDDLLNPYQQVIQIIGETLESFDDDGNIPAFGFGDISTKDKSVFPFRSEGYCTGFRDVLDAYRAITPNVRMSGPTNFAPLINQAVDIVRQTREYHILLIIADGQVTSEKLTRDAIVEASNWPLSIIMIGVGDGPWDSMKEFDDHLPARKFDNFQFVDFNRAISTHTNRESFFALQSLMEIPDQFQAIKKLGLLDM